MPIYGLMSNKANKTRNELSILTHTKIDRNEYVTSIVSQQ